MNECEYNVSTQRVCGMCYAFIILGGLIGLLFTPQRIIPLREGWEENHKRFKSRARGKFLQDDLDEKRETEKG